MSVTADVDVIKLRRAVVTGLNTEGHPALISDTQCARLINADLSQLGRLKKRAGFSSVANDLGADPFVSLARFNPQAGIDVMLGYNQKEIRYWDFGSDWSVALKTGFTPSEYAKFIIGNDKALFINGKDNAQLIDASFNVTDLGDDVNSPPVGDVGCFFRDRYFIAKDSILYYSDVITADFDRTSNFFRVNPGDNDSITNLIPFRNDELIIFKEHSIWLLKTYGANISSWYLQPVNVKVDDRSTTAGCVAKDAAVRAGDDIYFFAEDGVRSLRRNEQDKLFGLEVPESDLITSEWIDLINWQHKDKIRSVCYRNRIIFAVCSEFSTTPDIWLVLHLQRDPSLNGWSVYKTIDTKTFAKAYYMGQEKLYFSSNTSGQIFEMFKGISDNGAGFEFEYISRLEDLGNLNFQANTKRAASLFIRGTSKINSTVTVMIRFDENIAWETLGVINLSENVPTLSLTLPFNLNGKNVVQEKFNDLSNYGIWTNVQIRLYQSADPEASCEILEYMLYIQDVNDYAFD